MPEITVYSTPTCPYCVKVKDYLRSKDLAYRDVDVTQDKDRLQEMIDKSGQIGVPVIDIDGTIIIGFDKDAIDDKLDIP